MDGPDERATRVGPLGEAGTGEPSRLSQGLGWRGRRRPRGRGTRLRRHGLCHTFDAAAGRRGAADAARRRCTSTAGDPPTGVGRFFRPHEARTVEALTARIMPGSADDPGAREAGVVSYIDALLSTGDGWAQPFYGRPPFAATYTGDSPPAAAGGSEQARVIWVREDQLERYGYQSPLTPREIYRVGLVALDNYARTRFGQQFADLSEEQQDSIVADMAEGRATGFDDPSAPGFFELVREHTIEGMFCDPAYGGNRDMVGWRLVGYPGAQRGYTPAEMRTEGVQRAPQTLSMLHSYQPGQTDQPGAIFPVRGAGPHEHR